ncbi:MAG: hypothetical protein IJJ40_05200 [Clostridia bacterium]|nr:hypothetical protein [Clostridia bacterium]
MDIVQARRIIEALANGVNPITGEVFSKNSCFNEPDIIRALYVAKEQLIKVEKTSTRKQLENAGKPWSKNDDEQLVRLFEDGKAIKEIAGLFQRTSGSINSRLKKLGKKD